MLLLFLLSTSLSSLLFPSNFYRVKLLLDFIFYYTITVFYFARYAPIRLSNDEPTFRSYVLSLKEYLYFGGLIAYIW